MIDISRFLDESAVLKHINALSFIPEGSIKGERKIINYIQNELADGNIKNYAELFEWSDLSIIKPLLLVNVCIISFFEILLLFFDIIWILTVLTILIISFSIIGLNISINPNHFSILGNKKKSRNIIGEISAQNKRFKRPLIIFSAHYESTKNRYSQTMMLLIIIINSLILITFSGIIIIITVIILFALNVNNNFFELLKIISLIIGIMYIIVTITLYLNRQTNESDKHMSGMSGTAILIELAKIIRKEPFTHIDVVFLWTGAEKCGLWGIRNYCKKHFFDLYKEYELNDSYNFNIDKIGDNIGLVENIGLIKKKHINKNLNAILEATAKSMNINIAKITLPGILPHHYKIFKKYSEKALKKFQLSCFSILKKKNQELSEEKVLKTILRENLNNCLNLCYNTLKSLDKRIE